MLTYGSGRADKTFANKKFRAKEKMFIINGRQAPLKTREVSDVYTFVKDDKIDCSNTENEARASRK